MQAYHFSLCFVYQKKFREKYNIYFSCSGSFTGEKCDVELCDDASYCKNGGTCTFNNNHTGNKACQCAPGYTGKSIQINFSNVHWSNPYSFFHAYSYRIMGKYKINVDDWLNGLSLENWKKYFFCQQENNVKSKCPLHVQTIARIKVRKHSCTLTWMYL